MRKAWTFTILLTLIATYQRVVIRAYERRLEEVYTSQRAWEQDTDDV